MRFSRVTGPYPERISYRLTGMGLKKMSPKNKKLKLLTLTCLFVKRKFNETDKDFIINYSYSNKCGKIKFQFLTLLSTKLQNTLVPNSLDKLMQLISMEPLYLRNNWFGQITSETPQRSTKLMQLNYSYLKILKWKLHSLVLLTHFCAHITWWQDFTT